MPSLGSPEQYMLHFNYIVRREEKHISIHDQRRRVFYVLASYSDSRGEEYRKSFESYVTPNVPSSGTHKELNALAHQWQPHEAST